MHSAPLQTLGAGDPMPVTFYWYIASGSACRNGGLMLSEAETYGEQFMDQFGHEEVVRGRKGFDCCMARLPGNGSKSSGSPQVAREKVGMEDLLAGGTEH